MVKSLQKLIDSGDRQTPVSWLLTPGWSYNGRQRNRRGERVDDKVKNKWGGGRRVRSNKYR